MWGDQFGNSIAISFDGTVLVVGAPEAGATGAAYIFRRNETGWSLEATLLPPVGMQSHFGASVAISSEGETIVIGTWGDDVRARGTGSAYVYARANGV